MLFLEGGYYEAPTKNQDLGQKPQYARVEAPTDLEIKDLVETLAKRVIRFLKKKGYFRDGITDSVAEEDQSTEELLPGLQAQLLTRVFAIDMQSCPNCPGELKMVSAILEFRGIPRNPERSNKY